MSDARVLGVEGTAWAASAALYDGPTDECVVETEAYEPDSGGIHPREAAEHMREAIPAVVERTLETAREDHDADGPPVDAVAFSRGPGLGPCLRIVGTAARSLALTLDVPLVGVNHMVAHLEIGRHASGFADPVCLNASGANAHLLAYRNGRYRVVGETMDTGVGNAIDKFTRHLGWSHPGGPKVEASARDGEYVELPYVVKGMDFSFSGITSAATAAVDDGVPVEDVCAGLQETIFAMLTEGTERALSLTGREQLVLGGGVGQNDRLRAMLETMCDERGADFHAPEPRFLRDNAGMIAVLGAKMLAAGDSLPVDESRVDPSYRPDEVPVTWRSSENERGSTGAEGPDGASPSATASDAAVRGAEAVVDVDPERGRVVKRRVSKSYRHPDLDRRLRRERTTMEARLTSLARRCGVPTPLVLDVDTREATLAFEHVGDRELRAVVASDGASGDRADGYPPGRASDAVRDAAGHLATLHEAGFVHGDPTTRNLRLTDADGRTYLIDFGLGYHTDHVEDYAMDLHVLDRSLVGTAVDPAPLRDALRTAYRESGAERVLDRLADVEDRGRYVGG